METIRSNQPLRRVVREFKSQRKTITLVPTMGALHDGHRGCIELGRQHGDLLVVSIFVNPTQFGPEEDFDSYPQSMEDDLELCRRLGCDVVFAPGEGEIYPERQVVWVEPGPLAKPLCGASREGHFRGVCTAVCKLFHLVEPDVAVFGQKDAQQALVLRDMVMQLSMGVDLSLCPVIREDDGLACSSRNRYLTPPQRVRAARIYQGLVEGKEALSGGEREPRAVCAVVRSHLEARGAVEVEYVELIDAKDLKPTDPVGGKMILAVAGKVGGTRLIDNLVLRIAEDGRVVEDSLF